MENELIIDGQVIDLSETQENAEETIIQTESQPENESQDDNGKEVETEPEKTEETPEDYALRIGDEEIQLNADDDDHIDGQPAPQWVKDLRKGFKETQKENRELRRQLEEALAKPAEHQQPQPDATVSCWQVKSTPALAIALALNVRINSHPSVLPLVIFQGKIKTT